MSYKEREPHDEDAQNDDCRHHAKFIHLYAFFDYVTRLVMRYGVPDRDAADVAQDLFLDVFQKSDRYDSTRPAKPWLYAFAVRRASDYRSLGRCRREVLCADVSGRRATVTDRAWSAEEVVVAKDEWERVVERLAGIDIGTVFCMYYFEGLKMHEITRKLGISLDTGYSRLRRARDALRRYGIVLRDVA